MNKTKIVCTLNDEHKPELIDDLVVAGMDVARLNFSHTNKVAAQPLIDKIRAIREKRINRALAIMMDTKGPEVRLYGYPGKMSLEAGCEIEIISYTMPDISEQFTNDPLKFYTNLGEIQRKTHLDGRVLLMDGFIEGRIIRKGENSIFVKLNNNGNLRLRAHLTLPKVDYDLPFISAKDREDITYAVEEKLDYIALSFVSKKQDIYEVRRLIAEINPTSKIKLIAKVENLQAVQNLQEIIMASDGIMVARGDLGVELDIEDVPIIQKNIIKQCYLSGKPVITATQMLESMIENPVPTRAETSDVANACYDLSSSVMLSGETAIGKFPVLVVETMNRIIGKVERSFDYEHFFNSLSRKQLDRTSIVTYNAISTAYQIGAKAMLVFTLSGYSARMISKMRPGIPIYAFTPDIDVYNQLALNWGINPYFLEHGGDDFEEMIGIAMKLARQEKLIHQGDSVVIVAGLPMGKHGTTNMIRLEKVEKATITGTVLQEGNVVAPIVHISCLADLQNRDIINKIVLLKNFEPSYLEFLKTVAAIVTENEENQDILQYLASKTKIPTLINAKDAALKLPDGTSAELDTSRQAIIDI